MTMDKKLMIKSILRWIKQHEQHGYKICGYGFTGDEIFIKFKKSNEIKKEDKFYE